MDTRKLIVNADDFGWSMGVNRGIVEANRAGILTSTTLLANFPAFTDAVERAPGLPNLGIGLHLNIVHGRPLMDPARIPTLVTTSGHFPGSGVVLRKLLLGQIDRQQLALELRAQLDRFQSALGSPTHLDSHKHMHAFGIFRDAAIALARELRVPRLRCPLESRLALSRLASPGFWKALLVRGAAARLMSGARRAGIHTPDTFLGISTGATPLSPAQLLTALPRLAPGITELMCHPGTPSPDEHDVVPNVAITSSREVELRTLTDDAVKACVRDHAIELVHYGQI